MTSRKLLIVFALATMSALPAAAQLRAGVIGGINFARMKYEPDTATDVSGRTVFGAGVVVSLGLGEDSLLQLEPMYLQKGAVRMDEGVENEIRLAYLEVPVMLRFDLSDARTHPYIMAGPTFGFVMSAMVSSSTGEERDMKDEVKSLDFGLGFGAGVHQSMGGSALFLEGRYVLGSADINGLAGSLNPDVKTSGIQVFLGYTILLGDV
jgi:opacity protein-like surface antigen